MCGLRLAVLSFGCSASDMLPRLRGHMVTIIQANVTEEAVECGGGVICCFGIVHSSTDTLSDETADQSDTAGKQR